MAVPNVSNFSFWDVADEIYGYVGGNMSLIGLFEDANAGGFVTAYAGAKDRLSNFRGYSQGGSQYPPSLTTLSFKILLNLTNFFRNIRSILI